MAMLRACGGAHPCRSIRCRSIVAAALAVCAFWAQGASDLRFSIDPASPSANGSLTPADVLAPGPAVVTRGQDLGLHNDFASGTFDNLADFSYGRDPTRNPLYFSVDRVAVGLPGSAVRAENTPDLGSAAPSVFVALPPVRSNALWVRGTELGLQSGFFGDDLDALNLTPQPSTNTYFAIDRLSASNDFGIGQLASDLLVSDGSGLFGVYSSNAMMGLDSGDAIDGLVLWDEALDQVANPGIDTALFSLDPFSPDTFTFTGLSYIPCMPGHMSPADVCFTSFDGTFSLWASAASIGLLAGDNLDALATVPEPAPLLLLASGLIALSGWRAKRTWRKRLGTSLHVLRSAICATLLALIAFPVGNALAVTPIFSGNSPPVEDSTGALTLNDQIATTRSMRWRSTDPILGDIDTGDVQATIWNYFPASTSSPARLVFVARGAGATLYGDTLFDPYNRAVVDVVKGGQRVRYLVILDTCPCLACAAAAAIATSAPAAADAEPEIKKLPLGAVDVANAQPACFKVYAPDKWGGKLTIKTSAGAIKDLRAPDRSQIAVPENATEVPVDVGQNKHGWYTFNVAGSNDYKLSNTFRQDADADYQPWTFWYYPFYEGDTRAKAYDAGGPMEKYDQAFKKAADPSALDFEKKLNSSGGHRTTDASTGWWGHCSEMSYAAIYFVDPPASKMLDASATESGVAVTFAQDHMELFLGEWMRNHLEEKELWWIAENVTDAGAKKPKFGGADYNDKYAHKVYSAFRDTIFVEKQAFNIDMENVNGTTVAEKWNQGVFRTRAAFKETAGTDNHLDITIDHEYTSNNDIAPVSADSSKRTQTAQYRLIYKPDGTIDGSDAKQDYVFVKESGATRYAPGYGFILQKPSAGDAGDNPAIKLSIVKAKLGLGENTKYKDLTTKVPKD